MAPNPWRLLGLVVVLLGLAATPYAAADAPAATPATADGATEASDPAPGAHLAGLVESQDSTVRSTVAGEAFRARLANASTEQARTELVAERLDATERRLATLESRLRALDRARENGSLSPDAYTARSAAIAANASALADAANGTLRAAASLSATSRDELNVSVRVDRIRTRVGTIRDRASDATGAIDGSGESIRAKPLSLADVENVADRGIRVPDSLRGIAGSERINIHVRRANGSTAVFAVRTQDGRVTAVANEPFDSPSLQVYTTYQVVREIQRAEDPASALRAALEADRIRYDGQGIGNSVKYGVVKLASMIGGALLWLVPLVRP